MNWSEMWLLISYDLKDLSRQPVQVIQICLFVILLPLITLVSDHESHKSARPVPAAKVADKSKATDIKTKIGLFGDAAIFASAFNPKDFTVMTATGTDAKRAVLSGAATIAVDAGNGFAEAIHSMDRPKSKECPQITLYYDLGDLSSTDALTKVENVLYGEGEKLMDERLTKFAVAPRWVMDAEYVTATGETSHDESKFRRLADALTFFGIYSLSFLTSIIACGLFQEEMDKRTLGLLLLSPTSKLSIVGGKALFAIVCGMFFFAMSYATLLTLQLFKPHSHAAAQAAVLPPVQWIATSAALAFPLVVLVACISTFASTFARKPFHFTMLGGAITAATIALASVIGLPGYTLNWTIGLVPVSGEVLCFRSALLGQVDARTVAVSVLATLIYAGIALWLAARRLESGAVMEAIAQDSHV